MPRVSASIDTQMSVPKHRTGAAVFDGSALLLFPLLEWPAASSLVSKEGDAAPTRRHTFNESGGKGGLRLAEDELRDFDPLRTPLLLLPPLLSPVAMESRLRLRNEVSGRGSVAPRVEELVPFWTACTESRDAEPPRERG
jgi:hypothetical protein